MSSAQICAMAALNAKNPGFATVATGQTISYAGQLLNSILQELCENYDFEAAAGTYNFNLSTSAAPPVQNPSSVTQGNLNPIPGSGPFNMPADFLRAKRGGVMWFLQGVPYPMVPLDEAEFDVQVQQAGNQSYPYAFDIDMGLSPPGLYVYPATSGNYPIMVRYQRLMADVANPETNASAPWFPWSNYLVARLSGELMRGTDDDRAQWFLGKNRNGTGAQDIMERLLRLIDNKSNRAATVTLDRRRFGVRFSALRNTKVVGWQMEWANGHYWVTHGDGSRFVVLRQDGRWYCCGVANSIRLDESQILGPVREPDDA